MNLNPESPVAYIMKRYPRLSETFILNEIRAMERLGGSLQIFSLLPPEPPPHHPMVREVLAPVHALPPSRLAKAWALLRAHGATLASSPVRYLRALGYGTLWSAQSNNPLSVWRQFLRAGFVATTCRQQGVRHVHAHFANAPAAVAHFASTMTGLPFSFTAHAKDLYLTPERIIRRRVMAAEFVATCTAYNARYLRELAGEAGAEKVNLVYHGIDLGLFRAPERSQVRSAQVRPKLILSVGRLVDKKGHDDLIEACARLRARGHAFECRIVGEGPLREALQAQIARHNLQRWVTLPGAMTHSTLVALYQQADLFALAPRITEDGDRDGIPNVIVEAMAIGVPVVSTEVSGIPELVRHEQTGVLVAPRDPQALCDAMEQILLDPERAHSMAQAGRKVLEQDFDLWETTRKLHDLFGCESCGQAHTHDTPKGCAAGDTSSDEMSAVGAATE
ncbi:MAG: glycosyltransferase [Betaproteobacteria bacterium]|nr:glycosyltransferase [Betaproteobacteria bacterium]